MGYKIDTVIWCQTLELCTINGGVNNVLTIFNLVPYYTAVVE